MVKIMTFCDTILGDGLYGFLHKTVTVQVNVSSPGLMTLLMLTENVTKS